MSVVSIRVTGTIPDEAAENETILRDLEAIIRETLPPERVEAYVTSLRRLLQDLGYDVPFTTDSQSKPASRDV